ncbi:DivIVA domain-containing protein [Kytococcus aerolatus]|uniref:DivIVA domain-containing protein n=1 Tax=Kytococcus aerolatus TaxID=592308 RepID=A0A212T7U0_9MICO|nr:DivIVA domain-containing protein [Kytococcus aerolatus]SNC62065.1 DivIVA domain-containing protein [Kytococcus aerolatus]
MEVVLVGVLVCVVAWAAAAVLGRLPREEGALPPDPGASPALHLTDEPLRGEDLRTVALPTAVRGYRMAEVDALLRRLAAELDARQAADPGTSAQDTVGGQENPLQRGTP